MARRYLRDNKELVSQWHPTKNEGIELTSLTFKSGKKVWWKCPNGEDHEWQATVDARSTGKGCPYCSGRRASSKDNLRAKNPNLARQWHAQKNADLLPEHFKSGSDRKVWWQCDKNVEHAWLATIASRNVGAGCPYCAGKLASVSNNLSLSHPHLAQEWHPSKNKGLSPENVTQGSGKRVWWKCAKDSKHEWRAQISVRTAGYKCPYCSRRRASDSNNLTITHPSLAEQWHPTKNLNLRPKDFTYGSGKKVWWQCGKRGTLVPL